jgi:uncharacterized UBP type Zn finger protein
LGIKIRYSLLKKYQFAIKTLTIYYQNNQLNWKCKTVLPKIKSKAFIRLLPQIFELREQGYSYEEVTAILEKQHGLILSVNQFSVYLARYKNAHKRKMEKQPENFLVKDSSQEDKQNPIVSESNTKDYVFGTPEHKAHVLEETQKFFKNYQSPKIGLRDRK